ncbi:P63C domain-containing protein [Marivirga tractuosa]|uniref:P63C domain-containing protein n=1 Tax=Marivirga tractuosa TaxID=1006 RepID=UPI0035CFC2EE
MKKEKHSVHVGKDKLTKDQKILERQSLQQSLLDLTESKTNNLWSDEILDKENLKIQLKGGDEIDLAQLSVVTTRIKEYFPKFPEEYYKQIFRLNKWDIPKNGKIVTKPNIVGKWTKEIVYGRFSKDVLPVLEILNPYERIGIRSHKHHQYLSDEGNQLLKQYIAESIVVMKKSMSWYDFRIRLNQEYGVPFQLEIWTNY